MTKDEALQMCLEYIETDKHERKYVRHAIKAALEQPVQEPVAYDKTEMNSFVIDLYEEKMKEGKHGHYEALFHCVHQAIARVNAPAAQPEQKAVTCRFCHSKKGCWAWQCYHCGEIDDVQKPTPPAAQPEQEPVAWAVQGCSKMWRGEIAEIDAKAEAKRIGGTCVAFALYTEPPQRSWVGLTEEDFVAINQSCLTKLQAAMSAESILKERNK
jgi:hypothetical protein